LVFAIDMSSITRTFGTLLLTLGNPQSTGADKTNTGDDCSHGSFRDTRWRLDLVNSIRGLHWAKGRYIRNRTFVRERSRTSVRVEIGDFRDIWQIRPGRLHWRRTRQPKSGSLQRWCRSWCLRRRNNDGGWSHGLAANKRLEKQQEHQFLLARTKFPHSICNPINPTLSDSICVVTRSQHLPPPWREKQNSEIAS
jgi:hypothetical protein